MGWLRRWVLVAVALASFGSVVALVDLAFDHSYRRALALALVPSGRGQALAPFVLPVGTPFPVTSGKADQMSPAVAYDSRSNRYLVVWQDTGDDAGNIYGRLVEGSGEPWSAPFPISTAPGLQSHPAVSYNLRSGEYLVVWQDLRHAETSGWDVYAQRISGDGVLLDETGDPGANSMFNIPVIQAEGDQFGPVVAHDAARSRFLVVWENDRIMEDEQGGILYDCHIYGQVLSGTAQPVGEPFAISTGSGDHSFPTVVHNPVRGRYLVVWQRQEIWLNAQQVDGDGQLIGLRLTISTGSFRVYPVPVPRAAHNDDRDEYLVVWDTATTGDIHGRRLDGEGRALEREPFAISTAPQKQLGPSLGRHGGRGYLAVWTDERSRAAQGRDVYGQFVSADGLLLDDEGTPVAGAAANIPLSLAPGDQISPTLAYNGQQNEYLLVWQDGREMQSLGWEVYAQRYIAGAIGPTPTATPTVTPTPTITHTPTPTATPSATPTPTPIHVFLPVVPSSTGRAIYFPVVLRGN